MYPEIPSFCMKLLGLVRIQRSHLCIETSRPHMYAEMSEDLNKEFVKLKSNLQQGRTFLSKCKDGTLMRWRDSSGSERWTTWIWAPSAGPPTAVSFATSVNCCTAVRSLQDINVTVMGFYVPSTLCTLQREMFMLQYIRPWWRLMIPTQDPQQVTQWPHYWPQDLRDSWRLFLGLRFRDWAMKKMKERALLPR